MKLFTALALVVLIGASGFLVSFLFRRPPQDVTGEVYEVIRYVGSDSKTEVRFFNSETSAENRRIVREKLIRDWIERKDTL